MEITFSNKGNKNPIQILEINNNYCYEFFLFKKSPIGLHSYIRFQLELLYKSSRISEIIDNLRLIYTHKYLDNQLQKNVFAYQLNFNTFYKSAFFFLVEWIVLTSDSNIKIFRFCFSLIDFLSMKNQESKAHFLIEKLSQNKKNRSFFYLEKYLKKFDVFFALNDLSHAKSFLNKLHTFSSNEFLNREAISEVTMRAGKFALREGKVNLAVPYLIETLGKMEKKKQLNTFLLVELLIFSTNFTKNFRSNFLSNDFDKFPNSSNFIFQKILQKNIEKMNIPAIEISIKKNGANRLMKVHLIRFSKYLLEKKLKKIANTYLRIPINYISIIIGISNRKLKKKIGSLILSQNLAGFLDDCTNSFVFFKKKQQHEITSVLMLILIQLDSLLSLSLR
nr:hypothetical protein 1634Bnrm2_p076 [Cryptomonas sp.]